MPTTAADSLRSRAPWTPLLMAIACALLLGLSLVPLSATRIQVWPWAAFSAAIWLLPLAIVLYRLALARPHARLGTWLDAGVLAIAGCAAVATVFSPVRNAIAPHLLPLLGTCAVPYALQPLLRSPRADDTRRALALVVALVLLTSLALWINSGAPTRNAQPFGHANITGSVSVAAAAWFAVCALQAAGRARALYALGLALATAVAVSSQSRGAVIALAAGALVAAALILLRRGKLAVFLALALALTATVVGTNERLRDVVFRGQWSAAARESNDQRTAMIVGGMRLGAERPLLGWGPGSVPHAFPRVRADLPGTADNVVQLHNTPAQLWATLGLFGLLAAAALVFGIVQRLRHARRSPEQVALVSGLCALAVLLLFDHPFATPLFATLAAGLVAALPSPEARPVDRSEGPFGRISAVALALLLLPVLYVVARDLGARSAHDRALDHAAEGDRAGYVEHLRRAAALSPGDPYYQHLLAANLAVGHPFPGPFEGSPKTAVAILRRTLEQNPALEYAHYNLGWLLVSADPAEAERHFLASARLAPQRGSLYLGLGLARLNQENTEGAVRAFAAEWLLDPAVAWSPLWRQAAFSDLLPRIRKMATEAVGPDRVSPWSDTDTPAALGAPYRRVRTGYGVLMGHPEGPPLVDLNIQARPLLPPDLLARVPAFGWFSGKELLRFLGQGSAAPSQ